MATDVLERIYKLSVEGAQALKDMDKVAKATEATADQFKKLGDFAKKGIAGLTIAGVATKLVTDFLALADAMDQTVKTSQKLGLSVQSVQEWTFALHLAGVEMGSFSTAVGKVSQGINDIATDKVTDQTTALKALGVTARDTADSAMQKLALAFSRMADGPQKTALALEVFGKAGKELIPLLNAGAAGLQELTNEFHQLGGAFSDETAKRAEHFNDNLGKLAVAAKAGGLSIANSLLPALNNYTDALVESIKKQNFWMGLVSGTFNFLTGNYGTAQEQLDRLLATEKELSGTAWDRFANRNTLKILRDQIAAVRERAEVEKNNQRERQRFDQQATENLQSEIDAEKKAAAEREKAFQEWLGQEQMIAKGEEQLQKNLHAANEEWGKRIAQMADKTWDEFIAKQEEIVQQQNVSGEALVRLDEAQAAYTRQLEITAIQTAQLVKWTIEGDAAQQQFAEAQLKTMGVMQDGTNVMQKQNEELEILDKGWEQIFDHLKSGAEGWKDAWHSAVRSVIADLLDLWAKKYILAYFFGDGSAPAGAVDSILGEAGIGGTSAQSGPTSRTGSLGVSTFATAGGTSSNVAPLMRTHPMLQQRNNVQINVHNNVNGASVDVQQNEDGSRIDIVIDRVRRALASDMRAGGNVFAQSIESTYALGRARA